MSKTVNVGVIGAGRIGEMHAEHLAFRVPGVEVVAISDIRLDVAEKVAAECQIPAAVRDYHDVIENPDIEAVAIVASTDVHTKMIKEAAEAGKHIFCEKPIGFDLERIDRALDAVEEAGVKLQIGFNKRFDPSLRRARKLVGAGKIGTPHLVRITSRDPAPPPMEYIKSSGGIFVDMTIHDFDMARYLLDSEVAEVQALGAVLVDPRIGEAGDVDTAIVMLKYENDALGTIDNSREAVYGYDQRVEVFGSEGMVTVSNQRPNAAIYADDAGFHSSPLLYFFIERYSEAYVEEMKHFVGCIRDDRQPAVTGTDGRISVAMAYAAQKSLDENRSVKLAEVD